MKWNSTADFLLLYPYVMADTLGGDPTFERYAFKAGASVWKKMKIGAEACFRAEHEYRTTGPASAQHRDRPHAAFWRISPFAGIP